MSNRKSLMANLGAALVGGFDPQTGLVGRRHERTQGCWNCVHNSFEKAKTFWDDKRQKDLAIAARQALESPLGESDPKVMELKRMIDNIDHGVAQHVLTKCTGGGVDANENPVGDLVKSNYLCHKWSAAQGASVAREGQKADDLPMELEDKGN